MKNLSCVLPAGTSFYKSVLGHNNFVYPGATSDTIIEDTIYTTLSFVGGGSKAALRVSECAISHDGNPDRNVIIWVEKNKIL